MSDEIIKVLDDISNRLGIAIDWANENVIQQLIVVYHKYIIYSAVKHTIYLTLSMTVMIILLKGFAFLYQQYNKCYNEKKNNLYFSIKEKPLDYFHEKKKITVVTNDNTYTCIVISSIVCLIMLVIALYNLHYLIQAIITPEYYVLNTIRVFLRNM